MFLFGSSYSNWKESVYKAVEIFIDFRYGTKEKTRYFIGRRRGRTHERGRRN
jgi:hypothetical protein